MSIPTACFENIIGLSRRDCPCVEDRPSGSDVSESGLFLDELPGLSLRMINAAQDCGDTGIWAKMETARANAIEETQEELMACIAANTDPARQPGTSQVGMDKKVTATSWKLRNTYHGLSIQTAKVHGGAFFVDAIATAFKPANLPATITLNVYDREEISSDPVETYELPCTGNKVVWTDLPMPLELSMDHLGSDNPRFWFLYQPVAGMEAMNAEIDCGCGGGAYRPFWDTTAPQYASQQQRGALLWVDWAMAIGTRGNTLEDRDTWTVENPSNGLLLRVRFECDERTTFCSDSPNYRTDNVQKVIAHAVRFKAGHNLLTDLLNSTDINRYTMTAGDQLESLRKEYLDNFMRRVREYICPELSQPSNVNRYGDCRKCKDTHGLRRSTIRN